jgi:hypothetical protein
MSNETKTGIQGGSTPSGESVRERLRLAQKREKAAIARCIASARVVAVEEKKQEEALTRHRASIAQATRLLHSAWAELVAVSGVERAAQLVGEPAAIVRTAVRAHDQRAASTGGGR